MLLYSFVSNNNWVSHFQIPRFLLLRHRWTPRFFPFSDTVGSRGLFLVWKPSETEFFSFFRHRNFPFSDTKVFACRKPSEADVSLFRTPSETDIFPFSEAAVFASKDTVGHRVFPFSDKNVLIYSGAWACYPQVPIWLTAEGHGKYHGNQVTQWCPCGTESHANELLTTWLCSQSSCTVIYMTNVV